MSRVIAPKEAMGMARAQLSDNQRIAYRTLLEGVDRWIREHVTHFGVTYRTSTSDPDVVAALVRTLQRAGWLVTSQPLMEQSPVTGQPVIGGFVFGIQPKNEDVEEIEDESFSARVH